MLSEKGTQHFMKSVKVIGYTVCIGCFVADIVFGSAAIMLWNSDYFSLFFKIFGSLALLVLLIIAYIIDKNFKPSLLIKEAEEIIKLRQLFEPTHERMHQEYSNWRRVLIQTFSSLNAIDPVQYEPSVDARLAAIKEHLDKMNQKIKKISNTAETHR